MRLPVRAGLVLVATLAAAVPDAIAAPDFSKTTIAVDPATPLEADVVTFAITLRNAGPDDAGSVYVTVEWPLMGFFVDATGIDGAAIDHDARLITLNLPLPAGGEHAIVLRTLAPRDSGGDALTVALRMSHFASDTNHYDRGTVSIDTRLADAGVPFAGVRITRAGLVVLGVLAGGFVLWLALAGLAVARRRARQGAPKAGLLASRIGPASAAAALTFSVGLWLFFATMAWRDYSSLSWPETACTVLGGRLSAQTTTRSGSRTTSGAPRDQTNYVPVLGLKYVVNGRETYSSGYDTGSRLGIGGRGGRAGELAQWTVGGTTPCWVNPDDPLDVVVLRGFGGAYLFALFPIPVFWIGLAGARALVSRD